jgi:hypothetical protein
MASLSRQELLPLVESVAADHKWLENINHVSALQDDRRDQLPASFQRLLAYIDAVPELDIFRDGYYWLANARGLVPRHALITFLIRRTRESSAATAVADLLRYTAADIIPCIRRTLVCGACASSPFQVDEFTRFIPWGQITDDGGDQMIQQEGDRLSEANAFAGPSGILEIPIQLPRYHVKASAEKPKAILPPALLDARSAVMALQLVCPNAVFGPVTWLHFPDWVICAPRGMRYFQPIPQRVGKHSLTEADISTVQSLFRKITALSPDALDHLWPVIHRLALAQSHLDPAENAIDLRIAYEMTFFFGDNSKSELRFRLALHAARLLGQTYEERERIRALGIRLYDMTSGAVHAGRISGVYEKTAHDILRDGAVIVREALKHIVLNGPPDWKRVLLEPGR